MTAFRFRKYRVFDFLNVAGNLTYLLRHLVVRPIKPVEYMHIVFCRIEPPFHRVLNLVNFGLQFDWEKFVARDCAKPVHVPLAVFGDPVDGDRYLRSPDVNVFVYFALKLRVYSKSLNSLRSISGFGCDLEDHLFDFDQVVSVGFLSEPLKGVSGCIGPRFDCGMSVNAALILEKPDCDGGGKGRANQALPLGEDGFFTRLWDERQNNDNCDACTNPQDRYRVEVGFAKPCELREHGSVPFNAGLDRGLKCPQ